MGRVRVLAVAATAALLGCGESEAESAKSDVEAAVQEYATALKDKDYDKACESIIDASRLDAQPSGQGGGQGGGECPEVVEKTADAGVTGVGEIPHDGDIEFSSVKVTGDEATVKIKGGDEPPAKMKKEGDEWKFAFAFGQAGVGPSR